MTPDEQHIETPFGEHGEQAPSPAGAAPAGAGGQQAVFPEQVADAAAAEAAAADADGTAVADLADLAAPELTEEDALAHLHERAARADEYLGLAQRTQADFENFRKRMARDVRAAEARGTGRLAKELLPALDNLERALAAVEADEPSDEHHLTKGVRLVQSELAAALNRSGIEGFVPTGARFDPVEHDAVAQQPFEGAEPGTVVEVLQSGYRLNGAILRPARVIVAG